MSHRIRGILTIAVLAVVLLAAALAQAATVDLFDYMIPSPPNRWCSYTYTLPAGFPGFTLRITPITSGNYLGKYYWGTWNIPNNETDAWRIVGWDATNLYMYANQLSGDLPFPVVIPRVQTLDTVIPSPIPGDASYPWYYTFRSSFTVPAGTFDNVLWDLVLDINYPPNSMNTALGLTSIPAITNATVRAQGIGEIWNANLDAATGSEQYVYELQNTGISGGLPALSLLLSN